MKLILILLSAFLLNSIAKADVTNQQIWDADMHAITMALIPFKVTVACASYVNATTPLPPTAPSIEYNVKLSDGSIKYFEIENDTVGDIVVGRVLHGPLDAGGVWLNCK